MSDASSSPPASSVDHSPTLTLRTKEIVDSPPAASTVFPHRQETILVDQRDILPPPTSAYIPPSSDNQHRNLILCFDGTGDQFDADNSNIVQLMSVLQKNDKSKQLVYYQSGIGTYTSSTSPSPVMTKLSLMLDAAIAWNLDSHVMAGYEFLMQNHAANDRISIFGFSRGAYTARSLAGMIHKVGLLPADNHQQVPFAYKMYTRVDEIGWTQSNAFKKAFCNDVNIDFLGVWDTVDSVGLIPRRLPFTTSNVAVRTFRHAVSIDERRAKFKSNLWNWPSDTEKKLGTHNSPPQTPRLRMKDMQVRGYTLPVPSLRLRDSEKEFDEDVEQAKFESAFAKHHRKTKRTDVLEVWFAGCHCDIGGGSVPNNTRNSLARIPLRWMIRECFKAETGIIFNAERLVELGLDPTTLYPHVLDRPPAKEMHPDMRIARRAPRKLWFQRVFRPKASHSGGNEFTFSPNPENQPPTHVMPGMEEEEDLKDALSPIYDQLKLSPGWWILEVLPFSFRTQNLDDSWKTHFRSNFGRARKIPHQVISPSEQDAGEAQEKVNLKVHRTVKQRLQVKDHKGRYYVNRARFHVTPERRLFHSSSFIQRFGLEDRTTFVRDALPHGEVLSKRREIKLSSRRRSRVRSERTGKWAIDKTTAQTNVGRREHPQVVTFYDPPPELAHAGVPIIAKSDHTTATTTDSYSPAIGGKNHLPRKFTSPPLIPGFQRALVDLFGPEVVPTPIQALALKWVVDPWSPERAEQSTALTTTESSGAYKEILLAAETGSGKSIAYLLPMLQALKLSENTTTPHNTTKHAYSPRALVLTPTHELARQIASSAKMLLHAPDTKLRVLCVSRANTAARDSSLAGKTKQKTNASTMKATMLSFMEEGPGEFDVGDGREEPYR
ncbi:hypothetical protein MIND_01369700 [Mycena indigotica]|uniref:Helicase ATP-binding domain-containing protein n=1 Tax=Mycena indigotica TaxID=2126181 RepID=A0A8H6S265_9AGAR|nr:uncharacterized protein MIND_01369700 [Mycena indigotica]KAF7289945.1 hypothetical protein MIND_01369700 [Mycena indigotica]